MYDDINFDNTTESATGNGKNFDKYSNVLSIRNSYTVSEAPLELANTEMDSHTYAAGMIVKQPCNFLYNLYIIQSPRSQLSGYFLRT